MTACAHPTTPPAPGISQEPNARLSERPLIVKPAEGEMREWRPLPGQASAGTGWGNSNLFTIKIDRQHGGSSDAWFGTEDMPPGAEIPLHRHLHEDEVLYIPSGIAHAHVGALEGDAPGGSLIFVPRNTWVSIKNVGKTTIRLLFAFNAPGFDRYMRCESVPAGHKALPLDTQEDARCTKLGDVQYR